MRRRTAAIKCFAIYSLPEISYLCDHISASPADKLSERGCCSHVGQTLPTEGDRLRRRYGSINVPSRRTALPVAGSPPAEQKVRLVGDGACAAGSSPETGRQKWSKSAAKLSRGRS